MLIFLAIIENEHGRGKLEALYIKYCNDMFRVAYRVLKDWYLAQDAVQTAFLKLADNLDKIDEINCNKTRAFVVIIVRNIPPHQQIYFNFPPRKNHLRIWRDI